MYLCRVGMKIRWEEWIAQDGADTVFFDSSLPNNGLNKKASQYSLKEGYGIRAFVDIDMIQDGITTTYRFSSPAFDIRDYDVDQYVTPQWSSVIQTFAPNGTEITPSVLTDDYTTFRVTHTWLLGPIVDISDFYVVHRIEEANAQGQIIEELSSITERRPITDSKLVGIAGETRTKITLSGGGEVVSECRIDPDQIASSTQYKLSCRLGSLTGTPLPVLGQKLAEDDTPKQKEDNDIKLLE